ncbi:response regulator [Candidatus Altiarchaeota archaeon]
MDSSNNRVLVVDDEPSILETFKKILAGEGFEVLTASSGQECLDKLQSEEVDLLLLDFFMPGMSGREVCEKIRADSKTKNLKIVFVTAAEFRGEGKKILDKLGITDYIEKPVEASELTSRVKRAISHEEAPDIINEMKENQTILLFIPDSQYTDRLMNTLKELGQAYDNVLYISTNKNYPLLQKSFAKYGIDEAKFHFIDCMSVSVNPNLPRMENCSYISSPSALTELEQETSRVMERKKIDAVVLDSPSALLIYHEDTHPVLQLIHRLICKIGVKDSKIIFPNIREDAHSPLAEDLKMLADKIITLEKT